MTAGIMSKDFSHKPQAPGGYWERQPMRTHEGRAPHRSPLRWPFNPRSISLIRPRHIAHNQRPEKLLDGSGASFISFPRHQPRPFHEHGTGPPIAEKFTNTHIACQNNKTTPLIGRRLVVFRHPPDADEGGALVLPLTIVPTGEKWGLRELVVVISRRHAGMQSRLAWLAVSTQNAVCPFIIQRKNRKHRVPAP
nr:hypothetical protein CFP56_28514 [Quercus suber]